MPHPCMLFASRPLGFREPYRSFVSGDAPNVAPARAKTSRYHVALRVVFMTNTDRSVVKSASFARSTMDENRRRPRPPPQAGSVQEIVPTPGRFPSGRTSVRWPPQVMSPRTTSSGATRNQVTLGEGMGSNTQSAPIALPDADRQVQSERFAMTPTSKGTPKHVGPPSWSPKILH